MKIVFFGTPHFASGALEALTEAGHEIVCAVTQPDRPKGRGKEMQFPPVKECALRHGIPVFQPVRVKAPEAVAELRKYEANMFVVAAFGQILSSEILHMPKYGCINIHASLLPRYRGAAPIQRAIIDGEAETGVTIMQMDEGIDTGDMLAKTVVPIEETDTGDSLHDKLTAAGAALIVRTIPLIAAGKVTPQKQDDSESCYAAMLKKSDGEIDWGMDAEAIARLVRGLTSWPGCYTKFRGKNLKIWEASPRPGTSAEGGRCAAMDESAVPGTVEAVTKETMEIWTGKGILIVKSVQLEGKKRMHVKDFFLGYPVGAGERLG